MNLPAFYHTHIEQLTAEISILKRRNRLFVIGEIVFFLALVGFVILYTLIENGGWTLYVDLPAGLPRCAAFRREER